MSVLSRSLPRCRLRPNPATATTTLQRRLMSSSAVPSLPLLPLKPLSVQAETAEFNERVAKLQSFFSSPRFAHITRPYSAADVASKQGSLPVLPLQSTLLSDKLFNLLSEAASEARPVHTMGAIDPVQMTQMAPHQEIIYVSGWACSSVLTTGSNEVGPDFG